MVESTIHLLVISTASWLRLKQRWKIPIVSGGVNWIYVENLLSSSSSKCNFSNCWKSTKWQRFLVKYRLQLIAKNFRLWTLRCWLGFLLEKCLLNSAVSSSAVEENREFLQLLHAPAERGGDRYTQWISRLQKQVDALQDQNTRRFYVSCLKHLQVSVICLHEVPKWLQNQTICYIKVYF